MIESTAAALGYGLLSAGTKNILVVDIGGGTTDVTVMSVKDNVKPSIPSNETIPEHQKKTGVEVTVMATAGHSQVSILPSTPSLPLSITHTFSP